MFKEPLYEAHASLRFTACCSFAFFEKSHLEVGNAKYADWPQSSYVSQALGAEQIVFNILRPF